MPQMQFPHRLKYVVLFLYSSIAVIALVFSFMGVTWVTKADQFFVVKHKLVTDGTLAVAIGLTIVVSVILGIYAVLNENTCLLAVYGGILMSTFVVLVVYGAHNLTVILASNETVYAHLEEKLRNILNEDFYAENLHKDLIRLQIEFKCCGSVGPEDYPISIKIPSSCCAQDEYPCDKPFELGCARAITNKLNEILKWNGIFAIAIAVLSFVGATLILTVSRSKLKAMSSGISI